MPKKYYFSTIILSLIIFLIPLSTEATNLKNEKNFYLSAEETISGNLYIISQNIVIDGEVQGDVIALASSILINGRIEGDLIAAASQTEINGEINGSIRLAGEALNINGQVARNVNFAGKNLILGESGEIGWDLLSGALSTKILGLVNANVYNANGELIINGKVKGNIHYSEQTNLLKEEGSIVLGSLYQEKKEGQEDKGLFNWWQILIYKIIATLLIALLIFKLNKKWLLNGKLNARHKPWRSLALGLTFFILSPLLSIILLATFIGAPLALIIILLWLVAILTAKAFASFYIGTEITKHLPSKYQKNELLALVIGSTVLFAILLIPVINIYLSILINAFVLGTIIINIRK
jgi:cytoskeletal protein CcmA (bactofilin family)